jgi:L-fuconolactonase
MIIDTHTHFYDPARPEGVPWPNPEDDVLYRRVLPEHHKALAVPEGVTGTVVVEASPWVDDNQWILDLAANEPFIVGFVGHLQIDSADFEQNLEHYSANPLFRGIRLRGVDISEVVQSENVSRIEMLAAKGLEVDLLSSPDALPGVASLAAKIPELRIVINHVAGVPIDGKTPDATWVEGMQMAAANPYVYCKVSGLVESTQDTPAPTDVAYYVPTVDVLWDAFGEDRLVYGSNWPVSERFADYATVQQIVSEYFDAKGAVAAEKYFWKNSMAAYKWIDRGQ